MPTTQLLGSVGHVGSTWNTGMAADFAGFCAAPGSTQRPTTAITISPINAHRIIVFRIQAPFLKARGATTLESIYPSLAWRRAIAPGDARNQRSEKIN